MIKKYFLYVLIFLTLIASVAKSGWEEIGTSESLTLYYDPTLTKEERGIKYIWVLTDIKVSDRDYKSRIVQMALDCARDSTKTLNMYLYSNNMGKGEIIRKHENIETEWKAKVPGSVGFSIVKKSC